MQLNHDNYFSPEAMIEYMSTSQFKSFEKCEAAVMAELYGLYKPEDKECYLEGKLFEAAITGNEQSFLDDHPEMVSSRGATKGQLKSNYKDVIAAADAFLRQEVFADIIKRCEQQVIVTGVIGGVKFKGCVDFYDPVTGNGYDSKCMRNFSRSYSSDFGCSVNWYFAYGYQYQLAIYRELIKQTFGRAGRQHLIAATKETVPNVAYICFADTVLDSALEIVEEFAPRYDAIKRGEVQPKRCEHCDYCKETKIIKDCTMIGDYD